MNGRLLLVLALLGGSAIAATKSYTITLYGPATVGGMELQPGSYKLDVGDQRAVIHDGRRASELPVKVETNNFKYGETTIRLSDQNGRRRVEEIHLGGTHTRLVIGGSSGGGAGQ